MRFPTTKIEVAVLGLRSLTNLALGNGLRFKAAAYWLLPLWLLMEIFSGALLASNPVLLIGSMLVVVFGAVTALSLTLLRVGAPREQSHRSQGQLDCRRRDCPRHGANGNREN
jgi:hypothetical protein